MRTERGNYSALLCTIFLLIFFSLTRVYALEIPTGFSSESIVPPSFVPNNSTALSVGMDPTGQLYSSNGYQFSPVNFSGPPVAVESLRPPIANNAAITDLIYDQSGNLYIADYLGGRVLKREPGEQSFTTFASGLSYPRELTFDGQGNLLVAGKANPNDPGTIWKITPSGTVGTLASGFSGPVDLATSQSGNVYMLVFSGAIYEVLSSGSLSLYADLFSSAGIVGSGIGYPEAFAIDNSGNMGVSINEGQRFGKNSSEIYRISPSLQLDLFAFGVGDIPVDMLFTPSNELVLADYDAYTASRVIKIAGDFNAPLFDLPSSPSPIPEPSTLLLLGSGLAGLGGIAWRRHCKG